MALLWVICTMICNFVQTTVHLEDFADAAFVSEQAFIWLSKIARFLVILAVNFCSIISQNNYWRDASNLTNFTVSYPGAIGRSAQGTMELALPSPNTPCARRIETPGYETAHFYILLQTIVWENQTLSQARAGAKLKGEYGGWVDVWHLQKILKTPIGRAIRGIGRAIVFMILPINIYCHFAGAAQGSSWPWEG